MTLRRYVELVRLANELGHPRQVVFGERRDNGPHLERAVEVLDRLGGRRRGGRLAGRTVVRRMLGVLVCERRGFEQQVVGERVDVARRIWWQRDHVDLRKHLANDLALGPVAVDEDERVDADVERLSDRAQLLGLRPPVCDEDGYVGTACSRSTRG